jgi:hypothetical protein
MTRNKLSILLIALLAGSLATEMQAANRIVAGFAAAAAVYKAWPRIQALMSTATPPGPATPSSIVPAAAAATIAIDPKSLELAHAVWEGNPLLPPLKEIVMGYLPSEPQPPVKTSSTDVFYTRTQKTFISLESIRPSSHGKKLYVTGYIQEEDDRCCRFEAPIDMRNGGSVALSWDNIPRHTRPSSRVQSAIGDEERATVEIIDAGKTLRTTFDYPAHAALRAALLSPKPLGAAAAAAARPL